MTPRRPLHVVCVDGPLAGAETTCPEGTTALVLYDASGAPVHYRLDGLVSSFPGSHYAARHEAGPHEVRPEPPAGASADAPAERGR